MYTINIYYKNRNQELKMKSSGKQIQRFGTKQKSNPLEIWLKGDLKNVYVMYSITFPPD